MVLHKEKEQLKPQNISEQLDIPKCVDEKFTTSYAIVIATLIKLSEEGKVERVTGSAKWKLTDSELSKRNSTN